MAPKNTLVDQWGNPVKRAVLKEEVSAATLGGVRSPISGTPADGLDPVQLANILRAADQGDPIRYLELAEIIEERDAHYRGVISTRRMAVSQIDINVTPASDDARDIDIAKMVETWLDRDELADELFDILDAVPKGYSFTEIIWDTSEGQWMPDRLEYRDPRWFTFDRKDLKTPMMFDEYGQERPLDPFKFIQARIKSKSGIDLRSGLSRVAMWGYLFKNYTQKAWAIFSQNYGQPVRIGKYGDGASERDKDTLFDAVANIAGDCAAIIPQSMMIDFVESGNIGTASSHYKERCDWFDLQISKAVLGQTATTDAVTGGLGSGKEHREVQEVIERSDAKSLSAILNRDLGRPWIDLNYGPQKAYPRIKIGRPEVEDLQADAENLKIIVDLGARVSEKAVLDKFGWATPADGERILAKTEVTPPLTDVTPPLSHENGDQSAVKHPLNGQVDVSPPVVARQAEEAPQGDPDDVDPTDVLTDRLAGEGHDAMRVMFDQIEAMLAASNSFDELREMLANAFPDLDDAKLAETLDLAMTSAITGGRVVVAEADADA